MTGSGDSAPLCPATNSHLKLRVPRSPSLQSIRIHAIIITEFGPRIMQFSQTPFN